jgi:hypothetical protein
VDVAERTSQIADRRDNAGFSERLWCKDSWMNFPVWRVPVEALLLNPDNKRFTTSRSLIEHALGRSLDPANRPEDEQAIIAILLDKNLDVEDDRVVSGGPNKDAAALRDDWESRGQVDPIWIRPDGTIHNGNRRVAMLKREIESRGREGREFVNAVILEPTEVSELDLFRMEQREQFAGNFKVAYTDVDLLVALRDAAEVENIDWYDPDSIDRVALLLRHVAGRESKDYATVQLFAIRYMDEYLADIGAPGQYHLLRRQVERVREVGKIMRWADQEYPDDAADILRLSFACVKAGLPHTSIRDLRRIFLQDRERYQRLLTDVSSTEDRAFESHRPHVEEPDTAGVTGEADEGDDGDTEEAPSVVADYPQERVSSLVRNAADAVSTADSEIVDNVEQAWNRLRTVDDLGLAAALSATPSLVSPLTSLVTWANTVGTTVLAAADQE